jgi:hypothetical protein
MSLKVVVSRSVAAAVMLLLTACATTTEFTAKPAVDLTGIWHGETRVIPCLGGFKAIEVGRCNAVNQVTFALRQTDSTLTGTYRCAIGTMVCRHANITDYGTLMAGRVSGRDVMMRVLLPGDLSSCLYNGAASDSDRMRGTYRCYQGGGLVEVGQWQVSRGAQRMLPPHKSRHAPAG